MWELKDYTKDSIKQYEMLQERIKELTRELNWLNKLLEHQGEIVNILLK